MKVNHRITTKQRRVIRVRSKVRGTADRPRLSVFRSNQTAWLQLIDDEAGKTLVSATRKEVKSTTKEGQRKMTEAIEIAKVLAQKALKKGIKKAVFDRGSYRYHGRVKAVADTVREAGVAL